MKTNTIDVQLHFELSDFEEAFEAYKENQLLYGDDVVLVLSTHPYTEGYWIEKKPDSAQLPETDKMYVGDDVFALENRVKEAIAKGTAIKGIIL